MRFERIVSIKPIGKRKSYDLSLKEKWKGYLANGIQTHNSGGDFRSDFSIEDAFNTFEDGIRFKEKYPEVTEIAMAFEGQCKSCGRHAAGVCVSEHDLRSGENANFVVRKGKNVCNWDKIDAEYMGLMKLDVLGLNSLTILSEAKRLIKERHGIDINYDLIDLEDSKIYEQFTKGNTVGVFQFNSGSMIKLCREIHGEDFDQVVAINSLHRPGALRSGFTQIYRDRKFGKTKTTYAHPWIEGITKDTYGLIIYQEQAMRLMYELGGLTWKTADTIRKVISKSKGVEEFMKFEEEFIAGCERLGTLSSEEARKVFGELKNMGCLDGETLIARVGANSTTGSTIKLKDLYKEDLKKEGYWKKRWGGISILSMHEDGYIKPHKIKHVFKTGKKIVYYVYTESGKAIKATLDHRFLCDNGKWTRLSSIAEGDYIVVSELLKPTSKSTNGVGSGAYGVKSPPSRKGNGYSTEEKAQKTKLMKKYNSACQVCGIKKVLDMHHCDGDHSNNSDENTMLLCRKHHKDQHPSESVVPFQKGYYVSMEKIVSIKKIGLRDTYDIEMVSEPRSYVADNFVVHNSYSFNRSHACEYSLTAVWQMYLKVYYPIELMTALLSYGPAAKKHELINEAKRLGIKMLLPDINLSESKAWVIGDDNSLLAPFQEVKGIGEVASSDIVDCRGVAGAYTSPDNLESRVTKRKVNSKVRDLLIKVKAYETSSNKLDLPEDELEALSCYFDFELSNDPLYKFRKLIKRIGPQINLMDLSESYNLGKKHGFFFGRMESLRVGYRTAVGETAKSSSFGSLGGVYGNLKDDTDFKMLIFGNKIYNEKKSIIEHCEGEAILTYADNTDDKAALKTQSAWFGDELLSGDLNGLDISLGDFPKKDLVTTHECWKEMESCSLCELREECFSPVLPSLGHMNIMIVGEAPGKTENAKGIGFVGASGKLLWKILDKYGLNRELFHITNVCKCFNPAIKTPKNKHIDICGGWLKREIELVNPFLILSFGNTGNQFFRGESSGIMSINGTTQWHDKFGCWVTYSVHPAMAMYDRANMPLLEESLGEFVKKMNVLM